MNKSVPAAFFVTAILVASPGRAQQTPGAMQQAPAGTRAIHHLVYRFGYNTKATKAGNGTGTTTVDFGAAAPDGGVMVTATDSWWNTVRPRQSSTCELHPNGGVTCAQPPYSLSPIQVAIVPLLGRHYFSALAAGPNAVWQQQYNVRATFFPAAATGFAGQVYTYNCAYSLNGKGTVPNNGQPVVLVHQTGAMKQVGGRYIKVNQKANFLFDPRLKLPVFVDEELTFVPQVSVNKYTVELKLIQY